MKRQWILAALVAMGLVGWAQGALADEAAKLSALAKMPVKEVTIFKDGHAFVMHAGKMPVNESGQVVMDYLPTPVLGTYWPFSAEKAAKLKAVVAGQRKVLVERTALELRGLIETNIGQDVIVTEVPAGREAAPLSYPAMIAGVPERSGKELESTSPPGTGELLPQKGNLVLLKTADGVKAVEFGRIQSMTFKGNIKPLQTTEEFRNLLTLQLDWEGKPAKEADVGMFYLQRGLRWIPSYKVAIDGNGRAVVKLEASIINELADLEGVTAHLVIGVPTFSMENTLDPISLQRAATQLSQYFQEGGGLSNRYLSNAMMSQVAEQRLSARAAAPTAAADLGPDVAGGGQNEDLYVFTIKNLTLKKGQRMVLPIKEVTLKYRDVYTLHVPSSPPAEVWRNFNNEQQAELARLTARPRVMHQLRLTNGAECPLTTAPALILAGDRILGQGLMTFTSKGGEVDLPITQAVDIGVKKSEKETKRTPNAERWNSDQYMRIDLSGTLTITNRAGKDVELEVKRYLLGNATEAGQDGKIEMVNLFEDPDYLPSSGGRGRMEYWWGWYSWPYWWHHFNGVGKIEWKLKLEAGKTVDLSYVWNYYWR